MPKSVLTTLCYIDNGDSYLMLHRVKKKKADVNKDKWIGIGGHFEEGESPEECLLREAKEETGLTLTSFSFRGLVTFVCEEWPTEYMCLYTADGYEGESTDCDEGELCWVKKEEVTYLNLWEGDRIFLSLLAGGAPFFSLKLTYSGDVLKKAALNGKPMELLDVRDGKGRLTGLVRERSLVHRMGDPHGVVHIWVARGGNEGKPQLLIQKRSLTKDSFPGCLDISAAGHVLAGGDYLDGAIRELKEELSIEAAPEELTFLGFLDGYDEACFYGKPFKNREIAAVYIYEKEVCAQSLCLQREEVESVAWMELARLKEMVRTRVPENCLNMEELLLLEAYFKAKKENEHGIH